MRPLPYYLSSVSRSLPDTGLIYLIRQLSPANSFLCLVKPRNSDASSCFPVSDFPQSDNLLLQPLDISCSALTVPEPNLTPPVAKLSTILLPPPVGQPSSPANSTISPLSSSKPLATNLHPLLQTSSPATSRCSSSHVSSSSFLSSHLFQPRQLHLRQKTYYRTPPLSRVVPTPVNPRRTAAPSSQPKSNKRPNLILPKFDLPQLFLSPKILHIKLHVQLSRSPLQQLSSLPLLISQPQPTCNLRQAP